MRLFIGLPVPNAISDELVELQNSLPQHARKVPKENFHVTLVFLGECARDRVENLRRVKSKPFFVTTTRTGAFTHAAWLGIEPSPDLQALHKSLVDATSPRDAPARFVPHITLGRTRTRISGWSGKRFARTWLASTFVLYESLSTPSGVRYRKLEIFSMEK